MVECPEDASDIPDNPNIGGVIAIARFSGSAQLQGKVSRRTSQGLGDRTAVHVRQHERFPVFKEAGSLASNHSVEATLVQIHRQDACESGCKRTQIFRMSIRL